MRGEKLNLIDRFGKELKEAKEEIKRLIKLLPFPAFEAVNPYDKGRDLLEGAYLPSVQKRGPRDGSAPAPAALPLRTVEFPVLHKTLEEQLLAVVYTHQKREPDIF